jgi:transcriptional regulator with PAS, ATPase and Fis domain
MTITIPPLRERKEQILPFSQFFFDLYKQRYRKEVYPISSGTINTFEEYHWPGNIRELENTVKRIVLFGDEEMVLQDLFHGREGIHMKPNGIGDFYSDAPAGTKDFCLKELGKKAAETAEKEVIQNVLQETHWNRKEAAKVLRVSYKALLYKIEKYHLNERKVFWKVEEETG